MTSQTSIIARVRHGSPDLSAYQRHRLSQFFSHNENKTVQLTVRESGKPRTPAGNRYLWAIYTIIADWTGYTTEEVDILCKEEVHAIFKENCLPKVHKTLCDMDVEIPKSTKELDTVEFSEYLDRVLAFCAKHEIKIPTKEEFYASL